MGRGPAKDSLPDDLVREVRLIIKKVRSLKELTNADLARRLDWDHRRVTNALQPGQPLRLPNARVLLAAVRKLPPRRNGQIIKPREAVALQKEVARLVAPVQARITNLERETWPAVLIASSDIPVLAKWLVGELVKRPGISKAKLNLLREALESILRTDGDRFAYASWQRLTGLAGAAKYPALSSTEAHKALARFGWAVLKQPRSQPASASRGRLH